MNFAGQVLETYGLHAKSDDLIPVFINKVLLENNHTQLKKKRCPLLPLCSSNRAGYNCRLYSLQSFKYLLSCFLQRLLLIVFDIHYIKLDAPYILFLHFIVSFFASLPVLSFFLWVTVFHLTSETCKWLNFKENLAKMKKELLVHMFKSELPL